MLEQTGGESYPQSYIAAENLGEHRLAFEAKMGRYPNYTPASPGHYFGLHYWDQIFHSIIDARHGSRPSLSAAVLGMKTLARVQAENGFMANFHDLGPKRLIDLERVFGYESNEHSNYSQPAVYALGLSEVYVGIKNQEGVDPRQASAEAKDVLRSLWPPAKLAYTHIDKFDSVSNEDRRMIIRHPHTTGRDSDPTYDYLKPHRIPRNGLDTPWYVNKLNTVLDYGQIIYFGNKLRQADGDEEAARELFGACDLMMNCMLVDNLHIMADLAKELGEVEDEKYFTKYASDVEKQILDKMWVPSARAGRGGFYSTDKDGNPIIETTVNNLSPLLLPNLTIDQLRSQLELMDESFNVNYPIPSVGTTSRNYDPYYKELERLWRGPTWINTNWYLVERGLKKQLARPEVAKIPELRLAIQKKINLIVFSSKYLVERHGPREFYNPITSKPQRRRTKPFGWSNLAYVFNPVVIEL